MIEVLKSLTDEVYPYNFWRGPTEVRTREDAERGINCVTLAHMALARLGVRLPSELHANEMFLDTRCSTRYMLSAPDDLRLWRPGDVVFFGLDQSNHAAERFVPQYSQDGRHDLMNWVKSPIRHVAVVVDEGADGNPTLLHTRPGGIEIASIDDIMCSEWHGKVWGAGRPVALSK